MFYSSNLPGFICFPYSKALTLSQYVRFTPNVGKADHPPPAGIVALAMVYVFAAAFNMGWGPVSWIFVSEIPTNRLRAYNVALASFTHWVHNLAVSKATPVMLLATPYGAYFIFGSINLSMGLAAYFLPETKGVSCDLYSPFCKGFLSFCFSHPFKL